jgi:hypothetical protein
VRCPAQQLKGSNFRRAQRFMPAELPAPPHAILDSPDEPPPVVARSFGQPHHIEPALELSKIAVDVEV